MSFLNISGKCFGTEDAYLNALSGKIITQTFPGSSGTYLKAPTKAKPEDGPATIDSVWFKYFII